MKEIYNTSIDALYPYYAKNCLECIYYLDDTGYVKHCMLYDFNNIIPEIKNCDRGEY